MKRAWLSSMALAVLALGCGEVFTPGSGGGTQGTGSGGATSSSTATSSNTAGSGTGTSTSSTGTGGCAPATCADLGVQCGFSKDGCGDVLSCGSCPAGKVCGPTGACSACPPACVTSVDCGTAGVCVKDTAAGCQSCWTKCNGLMCQGQNTCVSDADCPSLAKCVCTPAGCTVCASGF